MCVWVRVFVKVSTFIDFQDTRYILRAAHRYSLLFVCDVVFWCSRTITLSLSLSLTLSLSRSLSLSHTHLTRSYFSSRGCPGTYVLSTCRRKKDFSRSFSLSHSVYKRIRIGRRVDYITEV